MYKHSPLTIQKISNLLLQNIILFIYYFCFIRTKSNKNFTTNIFEIKEERFRYLTFSSYSNGDMVLAISAYKGTTQRIFYGFKENGCPFFNNGKNYYYSFNISDNSDLDKYESESTIIKLSGEKNNGKEYFLSTGHKDSYTEIYDFKNNTYIKTTTSFVGLRVESFRNSITFLYSNNSDYYYLFGFVTKYNYYNYYLQIHKFDSLNNFQSISTVINSSFVFFPHYFRDGISCFITNKKIVICFLFLINKEYHIFAYSLNNNNIEKKDNCLIYKKNNIKQNAYLFYRCIHLKEEIGIFAYYTDSNNLKIVFKKYEEKIINHTIEDITLSNNDFKNGLLSNDIIRLSGNKICFSSINKFNTTMFFVLINIFNNDTFYKLRYYSVNINQLKGYFFHGDIRSHNYNNYIAFAFSFCESSKCGGDDDTFYSALMIFSYANSTDNSSDLYQFLIDNYNSTINDFAINLKTYLRIENNIFGYIFNGIIIIDLLNCNNHSLISSSSNEILNINSTLDENETIKLEFNENNYNSFNCNIQYRHIITEPDLTQYDTYPDLIEGTNETIDNFEKGKYYGKLTNYYIILSQNLSVNCEDNCKLCLKNDSSFCIICKYDFIYNTTLNKKECSAFKDDIPTSILTSYENKESSNIEKSDILTIGTYIENTNKEINTQSDIEKETVNILTDISNTETNIEKIYYRENKESLYKRIPEIINYIDIRKIYEITGEDYIMIIKPTNETYISSSTHVNFTSCENELRSYYNISDSRIITFLQVEIENKNEKSLVNQVEYQAYDDNKTKLNLNICNSSDIEIFYSIKTNTSLDLLSLNYFKNQDIDILNIKDRFFTDICMPFSKFGNDIVLIDRIIDFYQNYSLCENDCIYNEINLELMLINCNCSVKTNLSIEEQTLQLEQIKDIEKSMAFEIIKCYNLAFSWENKKNNIGFWIFLIFTISHLPLYIIFFIKGIKPIKKYIINEMEINGYLKKNEYYFSNKKNNIDNSIKNKKKSKRTISRKNIKNKTTVKVKRNRNLEKRFNLSNSETKLDSPPKKQNHKKNEKEKNKLISSNESNMEATPSFSLNKLKSLKGEIIIDNLNKKKVISNNKNKNSKSIKKKNNKNIILGKRIGKKSKTEHFRNKKKNLSIIPTRGNINKKLKKQINNYKDKNNEKNNIINLHLININLNTRNNNQKMPTSDFILNIYTFKEAITSDFRPICKIFYIYLLTKQSIFHAFLYKSPIVVFPLRFILLIFIISSDFALNSIFYFDDKISEKYRHTHNLFIFALNKNITVILLSTFIGFVLLTLFAKLSNSTNAIREVFKKEEEKMKSNKKYNVTDERKREILKEIEKILKIYKIKVFIFIFIELVLMLFFWYYVTIFCHVYRTTQKSWLLDSFLTILSRIIIDCLLCLGFAKLYRMAVESNIHCLYKLSLFFYSFC